VPLDRYGLLVGVLVRSFRDRPDDQGRWFHVNLEVDAPDGRYRCAVDVDSKMSAIGVQWKLLTLRSAGLGPVADLPPRVHDLARTPGSGALDFQRHPALGSRPGCLLGWGGSRGPAWTTGSHVQAAEALESVLVPGRRVLVFGEPFTTGLGMHNVHQNQGDPAGSQWWDDNGIWQDGATLSVRPDGRFDVFLSKFSSQAARTDADGHPAVPA
jgi:hypothetical protein